MNGSIAWIHIVNGAVDSHYPDDERHFGCFEIFADITNKLSHPLTVFVVSWINALDIFQHVLYMVQHQPVVGAALRFSFLSLGFQVAASLFDLHDFRFAQFERQELLRTFCFTFIRSTYA